MNYVHIFTNALDSARPLGELINNIITYRSHATHAVWHDRWPEGKRPPADIAPEPFELPSNQALIQLKTHLRNHGLSQKLFSAQPLEGKRLLLDSIYELGLEGIFPVAQDFIHHYGNADNISTEESRHFLHNEWKQHQKPFTANEGAYDAASVQARQLERRRAIIASPARLEKWQLLLSLVNEAYDMHLTDGDIELYGGLLSQLATHERGSHQRHMGELNRMRHNPAIHTLHVVGLVHNNFEKTWQRIEHMLSHQSLLAETELQAFNNRLTGQTSPDSAQSFAQQLRGIAQMQPNDPIITKDDWALAAGEHYEQLDTLQLLRLQWLTEKHLMQHTALVHDMGELRGELSVGGSRITMSGKEKESFEKARAMNELNIFSREVTWHASLHALEKLDIPLEYSSSQLRDTHANYVTEKYAIRGLKMQRDILAERHLEAASANFQEQREQHNKLQEQKAQAQLEIAQHYQSFFANKGIDITQHMQAANALYQALSNLSMQLSASKNTLHHLLLSHLKTTDNHAHTQLSALIDKIKKPEACPNYQAMKSISHSFAQKLKTVPTPTLWQEQTNLKLKHKESMQAFDIAEQTSTLLGLSHKVIERMQSQNDFMRFEGTGGGELLVERDLEDVGKKQKNHPQWQVNYALKPCTGSADRAGIEELAADQNGIFAKALAQTVTQAAHFCAAKAMARMPAVIRWITPDSPWLAADEIQASAAIEISIEDAEALNIDLNNPCHKLVSSATIMETLRERAHSYDVNPPA